MKRRTGPLCRIVGYVRVPIAEGSQITVEHELLECGHDLTPRHDIAGETNAYRRRCWKCRDGVPVPARSPAP
jgi:hypothetical protein